jgi:polyisoprenyl-teichoic acid--peptidoglycan teichoic acid transferase
MSDVPPTSEGSAEASPSGRPEFRHAKPPPRSRWALKGFGIVVVMAIVAVVAVVGYGWYRYNQIGREDLALAESVGGVQNFLIVGSDTRAVVDTSDPNYKAFGTDQSPPRSDTIMIARVDSKAKTVDLVSFPRDLWVPIMPSGESERINTAYNVEDASQDGAQRLVDTIRADFGIDINHYVEIDFASFKGVIDAVGGLPLYFGTGVRDRSTGFYQYELGCQTLNGEQALALSRSRHLEYNTKKGWVDDYSSDLGRIARQQLVMRKMVDRASARFGSFDLKAMNDIVSSTSDKLKLDSGLSLGDIAKLGNAFKGFSGSQIVSHTLPVYSYTTNGGAEVLKIDEAAAQPVLDIFRSGDGGTVTTTAPMKVTLTVSNGSGAKNQATEVSNRLDSLGYTTSIAADAAKVQTTTVVRYAPGMRLQADQVARQLASGAQLQEDSSLKNAKVKVALVTGTDFTGVLDEATPATTSTTAEGSTSTSDPVTTVDPSEVTDQVGYVDFEPPEGVTCG